MQIRHAGLAYFLGRGLFRESEDQVKHWGHHLRASTRWTGGRVVVDLVVQMSLGDGVLAAFNRGRVGNTWKYHGNT